MTKIKTKERSLTIEDAVSEAYGELQSLGEEMRDAFDNTPESLQSSGVGEARGEAADALENISDPTVPEELRSESDNERFMINWTVRVLSPSAMRKQSRSDRRHDAVETLNQVVEFLEAMEDDKKFSKEEKEAASAFVDYIRQMIDEAEAVDFPGMYG